MALLWPLEVAICVPLPTPHIVNLSISNLSWQMCDYYCLLMGILKVPVRTVEACVKACIGYSYVQCINDIFFFNINAVTEHAVNM